MSNADLGTVISSPRARKYVYAAYVVIAFIIACIQVGYAAAQVPNPTWLTVALAVVAFAATPVGGLAIANAGNPASTTNIYTTTPGS